MIMQWIEDRVVCWLVSRGYWVLRHSVPQLIISYGTGSYRDEEDGGKLYTIYMPKDHQIWAVYNTVLTREP